MRTITSRLGLRFPRSMPLMYVRSIFARKATSSCVRSRSFRSRLMFAPTIRRQSCMFAWSAAWHIVSMDYSPNAHREGIVRHKLRMFVAAALPIALGAGCSHAEFDAAQAEAVARVQNVQVT